MSSDMARERERRAWEEDAHAEIEAEAAEERRRAERREVSTVIYSAGVAVSCRLRGAAHHLVAAPLCVQLLRLSLVPLPLPLPCPPDLQRLKEVIDETATERERAVAARQQRAAAEAKKRERLKAAFLKRQADALRQKQQGAAAGQQQQQEQQRDGG